jgi:tRNA threonylcarbamoyladenosine biosynthesis protein TsaE
MLSANKIVYSVNDIDAVAQDLLMRIADTAVLTFTGDLGAGKTTLISALLKKAGVDELVTSPTFSYVHIYENDEGKKFYHFDLYRISSIDDFVLAGFEEYLYAPKSLCLIEWPEIIMPLMAKDVYHITIDFDEDSEKRILTIKKHS